MEIPQVSIIVPVYKVESFLPRCIESIQNQRFKNWELILVDDGSPDNSGKLCDEYAKSDSRIRVLHKKNGGVSSARNLGLENIKGEWVTFVDADDWLDEDTLEQCMAFQDCDLIRFSANFVYKEDGTRNIPYKLTEGLVKEQLLEQVVARKSLLTVWGCFFRASLLGTDIRFDTNLKNGEDWLVLVHLICRASKITIVNKPLYQYNCYNENSCIANLNPKKVSDSIKALNNMCEQVDSIKYSKAICSAKVELSYTALRVSRNLDVFQHISLTFSDILRSEKSIKEKLFVYFCKLIYSIKP